MFPRPITSLLLALFGVLQRSDVEAFPTGPPSEACPTISPDPDFHLAQPQTSPVPYELDLSALLDDDGGLSYIPGDSYPSKSIYNYNYFHCSASNITILNHQY